jgi:hypothetical protein
VVRRAAIATDVGLRQTNAPPVDPDDYRVVGTSEPRVDLPSKLDATFRNANDIRLPGTMHGRLIRPPGRNARFASLDAAEVAALNADGVTMIRRGDFVGVVAPSEWNATRAAATQGVVAWTRGPGLEPHRIPGRRSALVVQEVASGLQPEVSARLGPLCPRRLSA